MEILIGVLCGAAVAVFGIWAFLRGQRSMAQIQRTGEPEALLRHKETLRPPQEAADYTDQMRALFADAPTDGRGEGSC